MAYDLKTTCPTARWTEAAPNHLEYGAPGLEPCGVVSDGDERPYAWAYRVRCAIVHQTFSSRADSRRVCVNEACRWLRHVHCPGAIDRQAERPDPPRA